jgi:hypothetical protein
MNVASLELCRELYELSGWGQHDVEKKWATGLPRDPAFVTDVLRFDSKFLCPAYPLDHLLRKLPLTVNDPYQFRQNGPTLKPARNGWFIWYGTVGTDTECYLQNADTPEDAACQLAIELWKQGVLK